ncbi:MAG: radical SAM family heme chaperone HemW [Phycisphaerales bacterium]
MEAASAKIPVRDALAQTNRSGAKSLYIHIPFCSHKCHYCDFYSFVDSRDRQDAFTRRLIRELASLAPLAGPVQTIFVGGGTPSLLKAELWEELLAAIHELYDLTPILKNGGEFSVESNPESISEELLGVLKAGGVNRISMGAQSFNTEHLKTLERLHDPERVPVAVEIVRNAGIERVSVDLIYAIPGQSLQDLEEDLSQALAMPIEHLSCYELTYEPNTAMTKRLGMGEFVRTPEELEIEMFELVGDKTAQAGFERYEVSNYAKPGCECRHNLAYWKQEEWIAAGPSASAHIGGHRYKNVPRLESYLTGDDEGFAKIVDHEPPDAVRLVQERLMTGLRLRDGLDVESLLKVLGAASANRVREAALEFENLGQLERTDDLWRLTPSGVLLADGIAGSLMSVIA